MSLQRLANIPKMLRTHWKKTTFGVICAFFAGRYASQKYQESQILRHYAELAKIVGDQRISAIAVPRRLTVLINPNAKDRKSTGVFTKFGLPLLHLAGIQVDILEPRDEKEFEQFAGALDSAEADGVVIVGGDGTISSAITGIFTRNDRAKLPFGFFPAGKRNVACQILSPKLIPDAKWYCELTMAIVNANVRNVPVLKFELVNGPSDTIMTPPPTVSDSNVSVISPLTKEKINVDENKSEREKENEKLKEEETTKKAVQRTFPVFALSHAHWGPFSNVEASKDKYWIFGCLRTGVAYLWAALRRSPEPIQFAVQYTHPCDGCSKCFTHLSAASKPVPERRWYHYILGFPRISSEVPKVDYSKVTNEACGKKSKILIHTVEVILRQDPFSKPSAVCVTFGPKTLSRFGLFKEGVQHREDNNFLVQSQAESESGFYEKIIEGGEVVFTHIQSKEVVLETVNAFPASWEMISIDGDRFKIDAGNLLKVSIVPRALEIFCAVNNEVVNDEETKV